MYCRNCGKQIPDNVRFCPACGYRTTAAAPSASPAPSAPPQTVLQSPPQAVPPSIPQAAPTAQPSDRTPQPGQAAPVYTPQAAYPQTAVPAESKPVYSGSGTAVPPSGPIDWNRVQPRMGPARATALILAAGILLAAAVLIVWATAFITPGGLGEKTASNSSRKEQEAETSCKNDSAAAEGSQASEVADNSGAVVPFDPANDIPGELPASLKEIVNTEAKAADYVGSYTGTLNVATYDLEKLAAESGMPKEQLEVYHTLEENTYHVKADYDGTGINVISVDFPMVPEGSSIFRINASGDASDGCIKEEDLDHADDVEMANIDEVWFLNDGSICILRKLLCRRDGETLGGIVITLRLQPAAE